MRPLPDGSLFGRDWRGLPIPRAQAAAVRHYMRLGRPIYCTAGRARYAAITFDDGPGPNSHRVAGILSRSGVQATFFLVGRQVSPFAGAVRREARVGVLGDHTWSHPQLTRLQPGAIRRQLTSTRRAIERTSRRRVTLFRPPYELRNRYVDGAVRRMGLLQVLWNVDSRDYAGAVRNVEGGLLPGSIVLMHETYDWTVQALPRILAAARRKRLRLVTVPALLALDPPSDAMVRAGGRGCARR